MKRITTIRLVAAAMLGLATITASADRLVILHTNDTHSQIDPDDKDLGGVARRKVLIDSVRASEPHVLLIDAGDVVQGTLYFNLYGGEVEQKIMNALGYDFRILGNHEFDNGVDSLAAVLSLANSEFLATNYDLSKSPLNSKFHKYAIREIAGRRIGFIALNLQPAGMISEGNYDGVEYLDAVEAANSSAWWLKNIEKCDMVIAISHIGYNPTVPPGDVYLASNTRNIDLIIGGHSHDYIDPAATDGKYRWRVPNADGKEVLITQIGKMGRGLGEITIDLDNLSAKSRVIPVNSRLDSRIDPEIVSLIAPYRHGVDSLMLVPVGKAKIELPQSSDALLNWSTDVILARGRQLAADVDFAILNKYGIRRGLPKGTVTEGQIKTMLPFNNRVWVIDIKGRDLMTAFEQMARIGGNGVSEGVDIKFEAGTAALDYNDAKIESVTINGSPIDLDRTYRVATIDYLAKGGDYMPTLKNHTLVAQSAGVVYDDVLAYIKQHKTLNPSSKRRMHN